MKVINLLYLFAVLMVMVTWLANAAPDFSATHTLVHNWTFDGEDINATTRGGSNNWNLLSASGVTGNYLKYTGETTVTNYGYLYNANSSYLTSDADTWIIQGWVNNKATTDHSWLGIMIANSTTAQDTAGVSMHGNNYYHHNWTVRGSTEALGIYSAPNSCNGTAETWRYMQINITQGLAYIQVFTDSTLANVVCNNGVQRVYVKNMSQTYKQGYLGFGAVRSASFDSIELWKLNGAAPPTVYNASVSIATDLVSNSNLTNNPLIINFNGTPSYTPATNYTCFLYSNISSTATIGTSKSSAASVGSSANTKYASKFRASKSGYLTNLTIDIEDNPSSLNMTIFIAESNASGRPANILYSKNKQFGSSGIHTTLIDINEAVYVSMNTDYFLGVLLSDGFQTIYTNMSSGGSSIVSASDTYSDGLSAIWNGYSTSGSGYLTIIGTIDNSSIKRNVNLSQPQYFSIDTTGKQEGYYFNITCSNVNATGSVLKTNVFIDTVAPTLQMITALVSGLPQYTNNTVYYRYVDKINNSLVASDTNLFAMNFTVQRLNPDGSVNLTVHKEFATGLLGASTYMMFDINSSWWYNTSYANGRYRYLGTAWDSHTAREIKPYSIKNIEGGKDIGGVKVTSNSLDTFTTKKEKDRYTFDMKFKTEDPEVFITCENPFIVNGSEFKGHVVCLQENKWIDFEEYDTYPEVTKIDNKTVKVKLHNVKAGDTKHFKSIGDLNTASATWYFNLTDGFTMSANYSGYVTTSAVNYTKALGIAFSYICMPNSSIQYRINNVLNSTLPVTCDSTERSYSFTYQPSINGQFISALNFVTNTSADTSEINNLTTVWVGDLIAPVVTGLHWNISTGFVTPQATINFTCIDNIQPLVYYNSTLNGGLIFYGLQSNYTIISNTTANVINGNNIINVSCSDGLSVSRSSLVQNVEIRTLYMIDEQKNTAFDVNNISSVIVYLDDNRSSYDFRANNKNNISFFSDQDVKLRFELIYASGTIILRYVDTGLLENDIRVCANTEGITHYEQILTSSSTRPAILKSVFADCVVAADYTRFAYQDAKVLKGYTYNNLYYLYTFENNDVTQPQIFLASVDGSIASYINLDTLEFLANTYDIDLVTSTLAINKASNSTMGIYYRNSKADNTALRIAIIRMDTNAVLFNSSAFTNVNEATILFDFTVFTGVNATTVFKVIATETDAAGIKDILAYFTTGGKTGSVNAPVIFFISLLMLIFGLSMTATQYTFGWFGLLICIINIALLASAMSVWYITFMLAINVIIGIFIFLVMWGKNQSTIG